MPEVHGGPSTLILVAARKHPAGDSHLVGIDLILLREFEQQGFVACQMIEHAEQETRLLSSSANRLRIDSRQREERLQPVGDIGDEAQCCDGETGGGFGLRARVNGRLFARRLGRVGSEPGALALAPYTAFVTSARKPM